MESKNCTICNNPMDKVPVSDHVDFVCLSCGPSSPIFCTKDDKER